MRRPLPRRGTLVLSAGMIVVLLVAGGCGDDTGTDSSGGDSEEQAGGAPSAIGPTQLLDVPVELEAGEAARVSVNALDQVDLSGCLAVPSELLADLEALAGASLESDLRAATAESACARSFDAGVPSDLLVVSSTSADEWDDVLTDETAFDDDANVSGESFYEVRLTLVAPVSGTYHVLAFTDDDTQAEVSVETANEPADAEPEFPLAGLSSEGQLGASFPQYESFFSDWEHRR